MITKPALALALTLHLPVAFGAKPAEGSKEWAEILTNSIRPVALESAKIKTCRGDREGHYLEKMRAFRESKKFTEVQLAFMGGMHGGLGLKREGELKQAPPTCKK